MRRTIVIAFALVAAAVLFWFAYYYFNNRNFSFSITMALTDTLFYALAYLVVAMVLFPRYLAKGRMGYFIEGFILLVLIIGLMRIYAYGQISSLFGMPFRISVSSIVYVLTTSTFVVMAVGGVRIAIDWLQSQRKVEEIRKERIASELNFLKGQLNPHFFFNSINTLYGSIKQDNEEARAILLKLSDMLRYQLYECADDVVPLEKEAAYIQNFVDLQKLRTGKQLNVVLEIEEAILGRPVPPLLLAPLVENAFKYVSKSDVKENRITITLRSHGQGIELITENSVEAKGEAPLQPGGIGLSNLRKRLELMYGKKSSLVINTTDGLFTVHLKLPGYDPEMSHH